MNESEERAEAFGERRTRPHRQSQRKLTPTTVGENLTFDRQGRPSVRKGRSIESLGSASGNSRDAVPAYAGSSTAENAAQHNVVVGNLNDQIAAHNDLVSDVSELRRFVSDMQASLQTAKLVE